MLKKENKEMLEDVLTKYVCERYRDIENNGNARFTSQDMEKAMNFLKFLHNEVEDNKQDEELKAETMKTLNDSLSKLNNAIKDYREMLKCASQYFSE
jgi:flagellar biosynthesis chaperone FliJ